MKEYTPRPLSPEERKLPLARYYDIPIMPVDPLTRQILDAGPIDPAAAIRPEDFASLMMPPGEYSQVETGYCMMPDGSGYIAVYKRSDPRITPQMRAWYMRWMNFYSKGMVPGQGNLRYKLWMPLDHIDHHYVNGQNGADGVYTLETLDLGAGSEAIGSIHHTIQEKDYPLYGIAEEQISAYKAMGCSMRIAWESFDIPGSHFCVSVSRPCPTGGREELTREWIGYRPVNGRIVRDEATPVDEAYLKNVVEHNIMEFNHLPRFLPELYEEYKDKPLDAD